MDSVPEKLKPFAEIVSEVSLKKAAATYLKNAGGVEYCASLIEFTGKVEPFDDEAFWYLADKKDPCTWWRLIRSQVDRGICDEALKLSCIAASSASIERVFSTMGWLSSDKRNRLQGDKLHKLSVLHHHLNHSSAEVWWQKDNKEDSDNEEEEESCSEEDAQSSGSDF